MLTGDAECSLLKSRRRRQRRDHQRVQNRQHANVRVHQERKSREWIYSSLNLKMSIVIMSFSFSIFSWSRLPEQTSRNSRTRSPSINKKGNNSLLVV